MKEIYEKPKIFTVLFEGYDVVTISPGVKDPDSEEDDYGDIDFG